MPFFKRSDRLNLGKDKKLTITLGFVLGFLIPAIADRLGKVLPADWGEGILCLFHKARFPKSKSKKKKENLKRKWKKLIFISLLWGIYLAGGFALTDFAFPTSATFYVKVFLFFLGILTVVDDKYFLLPDVLTVPLLILGFCFAVWGRSGITPSESLIGAIYGYFVPALSVLVMTPFKKNTFGGGDVKMLAALGAWVGLIPLVILIGISVVSFCLWAIYTRQKSNAYGPHLALAGVIVLFGQALGWMTIR